MQKYLVSWEMLTFISSQMRKEMIDGVAAGENNGRVVGNIDLLFAEFFGGNAFQADKWMKSQAQHYISWPVRNTETCLFQAWVE